MANGNDNTGLIQNLDKVSYGVAGVLAVVLLCVPLFSGGNVKTALGEVETAKSALDAKSDAFEEDPVPDILADIRRQWELQQNPPERRFPAWSAERRPAYVQWVAAPPDEVVEFESDPQVTQIEYLRSAEKSQTYLRVSASLGTITYPDKGELTDVKLFRRKGEGEYLAVKGLDVAASLAAGAVEFDDFDVEPGMLYAYKVRAQVGVRAGVDGAKLGSKSSLESAELALVEPVPYDYALNIVYSRGPDAATRADAHFFGDIVHADFETGELVKVVNQSTVKQGFTFGPKAGRRAQPLWKIQEIDNQGVTVANSVTRKTETLSGRDRQRPVELPEPVTMQAAAPADPTDVDVGAVAAPADGEPAGDGTTDGGTTDGGTKDPDTPAEPGTEPEPEPAPEEPEEPEEPDTGGKKPRGPFG